MRYSSLLAVLVALLMVIPGTVLAEPGTHTVTSVPDNSEMPSALLRTMPFHYSFAQPTVVYGLGYGGAVHLDMDGAQKLQYPGLPRVPVMTRTIELPGAVRVEKVTATHGAEATIYLPAELESSPAAFMLGRNGPKEIPITQFYDGARFPADWFAYAVHRGLNETGEDTVFVMLYMYPARYEANGGLGPRLTIVKDIDVSVKYSIVQEAPRAPRAQTYSLVIIGPSEFSTDLNILAAHKTMTGLPAKFVTLDDIYNGVYFTTEGVDNQEKIKYFIKDALENWGTKYVILGGDVDKVPTRHVEVLDGEDDDGTQNMDGKWVPCDIYYGDIYDGAKKFNTWDENSNGVYGEWTGGMYNGLTDSPDLFEDVYIGRLPADTAFEMSILVQKIRDYENQTDWSWFMNAGLAGVDTWVNDGSGIPEGEYGEDQTAKVLEPKGFTSHKMYSTKGTLSYLTINSHVNTGMGIMIFAGHGGFDVYGDESTLYYENADINGMTNGVMLPVGWQSACDTGGFDDEDDAYFVYPGWHNDAMSEAFPLKNGGGYISDVGSGREAVGALGSNWPLAFVGYLEHVSFQALADGQLTPGRMLSKGRNDYMAGFGIGLVYDYKHMVEFDLMGDPSVAIGGIGVQVTNVSQDCFLAPGGSIDLEYKVKNTGVWGATFDIAPVTTGPFTLSASISTMHLDPGQEKSVMVKATADPGAVADTVWPVTLTAKSALNDRAPGSSIHIKIGQIFNMDLTVDPEAKSALPGDDVSFDLTVHNLGNGNDGASASYSDIPSGWGAQLTYAHVYLPVTQNGITTLNLALPAQVLAGSYWFNVTAVDDGKPDIVKVKTLRVDVLPKHEIGISCLPCAASVDPAKTVTLPMTLQNLGNVPDIITVNGTAPADWVLAPDAASYPIGPYASTGMNLSITPPAKTLAGDYDVHPTANVGDLSKDADVTITINRLHGIKFSVEAPEMTVEGGQDAIFSASVLNTGNGPEEVVIENVSAPPGWLAQGETQEFVVQGFDTYTLGLYVTTLHDTLAGQYNVTMRVRAKNVANLSDTVALTVDIAERIDASANLTYTYLSALPGKSVSNTVTIENRGNVHETITLAFGTDTALSIKALDDKLKVNSLTQAETGFTITVLADALAGNHDYTVMVKRVKGPTIYLNGTVNVLQVYKVDIQEEPSSDIVNSGGTLTKSVLVTNRGNGKDTITVHLKGNQSSWASLSTGMLTLNPGETREVTITISPPRKAAPDRHQLTVTAIASTGVSKSTVVDYRIREKIKTNANASNFWWLPLLAVALAVGFVVGKAAMKNRKRGY